MMPIRINVVVAVLAVTAVGLEAQVLTGRVTDSNGQPTPFVHVYPSDATGLRLGVGTLTDSAGNFTLRGARATHIDLRRLGYRAEAPRPVTWGTSDTQRVNVILQSLAYALPSVAVREGCSVVGSAEAPLDIQELWSSAAAAIAARAAFESEFEFRRRSVGNRMMNGRSIPVDTTFLIAPPHPRVDTTGASAPLITYRAGGLFKKSSVSFKSVDISLLAEPAFLRNYCVASFTPEDSTGEARLTMRERRPDKNATVTWTMYFRRNLPGPSRIVFDYFARNRPIGRAENLYDYADVDGYRFPLASAVSILMFDTKSGAATSGARNALTYSGFARVEGKRPDLGLELLR